MPRTRPLAQACEMRDSQTTRSSPAVRLRQTPFGACQLRGLKYSLGRSMRGLGKPASPLTGIAGKKLNIPSTGSSGVAPRYSRPLPVSSPPVATKNASGTHPSSAMRTLGAWYSTESFTTSTVSSIHLRSPLIFLPLPKAMTEPSTQASQARLARLTAIRIQEAFTEDERIGVVQPRVIVLRNVVRAPQVSRVLRVPTGLIKSSDEVRLWFPIHPTPAGRLCACFRPVQSTGHGTA